MKVLLVVYDNDSYIHYFPQGIAYIAAVLREEGHQVAIYNQDVHHYPDEHLTAFLDSHSFDMVGVGVIAGYYQYRKLVALAAAINRSSHRPFFVLGGHGPSPDPGFFMRKTKADAVVLGEGEVSIVELVKRLEAKKSLAGLPGIAYREGETCCVNPKRPLIQDIDTIPFPAYDLFPIQYYRLYRFAGMRPGQFGLPVLSGRGCTFACNFCYRMDEGFRPRASAAIIDEIRLLKRDYGITYILFSDELLMSSIPRTIELCEAILKADLGIDWMCNGRLNYAVPKVLRLMKQAGCCFINYGIESLDDAMLKVMRKALTVDQIVKGIEATLAAGISPGFNILFGNIGETKEVLDRGVDFLLKYDDGAQLRTIRPVTPYPGSPLYDYAIARGMIRDCEDFYENKHFNSDLMTVNFTPLSDDEYYRALSEANTRLIDNYYRRKSEKAVQDIRDLYSKKNVGFRGFRHT